jgi:hypothetical protein
MEYNEQVEVFEGDNKLGEAHFSGRATKGQVTWGWSGILSNLDFPLARLAGDQYQLKFADGTVGEVTVRRVKRPTPTIGGRPRVAPPTVGVVGNSPPPRVKIE